MKLAGNSCRKKVSSMNVLFESTLFSFDLMVSQYFACCVCIKAVYFYSSQQVNSEVR